MQHVSACLGVIALLVLALITVDVNVDSKRRCYELGDAIRESDDLRHLVAYRQERCRALLRTEEMARQLSQLGLTEDDLFPPLPEFRYHPPVVALSAAQEHRVARGR